MRTQKYTKSLAFPSQDCYMSIKSPFEIDFLPGFEEYGNRKGLRIEEKPAF
ncbi:hypothetical protein PORCRE_366 [Porphyromonas crevioricanis JCM 15906]|uniref:Uncharacterized protein n=1 Tax=Porphyromonas crevioricanis JCM 15906 TaxID=1305617 RepID=T1DR44_9PORP|nr:hypothetical protein PORCRE_366 [Porphyromonas crevioricanis JCM 15906]GAD07166.1 hypothetical protein PORCAN_783 [Porphyromonas crevioricanis JCM 13913]